MHKILVGLLLVAAFGTSGIALANPALTSDQLVKAVQSSLKDYSTVDPDMSKAITGIRSIAVGPNAKVTLEMKMDGMNMSVTYICVPQGQDMACNLQQ